MVNYSTTEGTGAALRECSANYVHECFLNGSGVVRVEHPAGTVEYIAGTRYDLSPLRWEPRQTDDVIELICTGITVHEFAGDVDIRQATAADLERDSGLSFQ